MLGLQLLHVGINNKDADEAMNSAKQIAELLRFSESSVGNSSIFVGSALEFMKALYLCKYGHIAFKTNSLDKAVNYLTKMGVGFNAATEKQDESGKLKAIYLEDEVAGFAIYLV